MKLLLAVLTAILCLSGVSAAANLPSAPLGRVSDFARALSPEEDERLTANLAALEERTGVQIAVVTVPSLSGRTAEQYARKIGDAWGVGRAGKDDGVVFLVAPRERKVFIATGPGIRERLPDSFVQQTVDQVVLPHFKRAAGSGSSLGPGIIAGANALIRRLDPPPAGDVPQARSSAKVAHGGPRDIEAPLGPDFSAIGTALAWFLGVVIALALVAALARHICVVLDFRRNCAHLLDRADAFLDEIDRSVSQTRDFITRARGLRDERWHSDAEALIADIGSERETVARKKFVKDGFVRSSTWSLRGLKRLEEEIMAFSNRLSSLYDWMRTTRQECADSIGLMRDKDYYVATLSERISEATSLSLDERVEKQTRTSLREFAEDARRVQGNVSVRDWTSHLRGIQDLIHRGGNLFATAKGQIARFEQAPAEAQKLLNDLPKQIAELERQIRRSGSAKRSLDEAREKLARAQSLHSGATAGTGLSGAEWLVLYLLLSQSSSSATAASTAEREAIQVQERPRDTDYYRSSSSYSDFSGFGGGGGFSGGGGGGGDW